MNAVARESGHDRFVPAGGAHTGPLTHHPELVDRLTADHWRMLALWHDAIVLFEAGLTVRCAATLARLGALAREHQAQKQTLLYAYLEQELPGEDERRTQLHQLRAGWPALRDALAHVTNAIATGIADTAHASVAPRLHALADAFRHRFAEDESGPFVSYAPAWTYAL